MDKYVNIEDKIIINVYEVLNSIGMKTLFNYSNLNPPGKSEQEKEININQELSKIINKENNNNLNVEISEKEQKNKEVEINDIITNFNLYSFNFLKDKPKTFAEIRNLLKPTGFDKEENKIKMVSFRDQMIYLKNQKILDKSDVTYEYEFAIPMFHYRVTSKKSEYLFRNFVHEKIKDFPVQYVILNNSGNFSAKELYDYIWNLNKIYMNHPNLDTKDFWWNKIDYSKNIKDKEENNIENNNKDNKNNKDKNIKYYKDNKNNNKNKKKDNNIQDSNNKDNKNNNKDDIKNSQKDCLKKWDYPFVLRYLEITEKKDEDIYYMKLIHCPLCPWYSYCPGCIIDPRGDLSKITSKQGIVVDWCYNFIEEELSTFNLKPTIKEIDSQIISENLPIMDKEQNYQSIQDCFNLFFEEEDLEDPLYCFHCEGPESFSKKYSINRLPYVLILSLKRFKFNQNSNFKLRQMITYPLYDLELGGKKYDLYGVINHYGSINSGHYTAIIKNKAKEWILCNDSSVYKIEEKRVMHSNAYILFYISKDSPYNFDYIKLMKSLMNNVVNIDKKNSKKFGVQKDNNFFKYEPVEIKMKMKDNIGYVMEENLENFSVDENYDIYNDLKKEDQIRIDELMKKDEYKKYIEKEKENNKEKEKNNSDKNENKENKKEEKKEEKKEDKKEEKKEDKKEEKKEENKDKDKEKIENKDNEEKKEKEEKEKKEETDKKEEKEKKEKIIEIKKDEGELKNSDEIKKSNQENESKKPKPEDQTNETVEINKGNEINQIPDTNPEKEIKDNTEIKDENEIILTNEVKPITDIIEKNEIVLEKETNEDTDSKPQNEIKENEENKINITSSKEEKENNEELNKDINDNNKKEEIKEPLPEYYKDFVKIKLEYGSAWIHKSRVEKIVTLEEKEKNKDKK